MQKDNSLSQLYDDAKIRIVVVDQQREIEDKLNCGSATFVVPSLLTPMFIKPEHVIFDKESSLFKLKDDAKAAIPDGLIPEAKLKDPKQLSTVLGRVLSVRAMLDRGVNITVLHVDANRSKADGKEGYVDATEIATLKAQYKNLHLQVISPTLYDQYKTQVCAATYCDEQSGEKLFTGIDASQINSATSHHDWGVKADQNVVEKIRKLDELLHDCHIEPINASVSGLKI